MARHARSQPMSWCCGLLNSAADPCTASLWHDRVIQRWISFALVTSSWPPEATTARFWRGGSTCCRGSAMGGIPDIPGSAFSLAPTIGSGAGQNCCHGTWPRSGSHLPMRTVSLRIVDTTGRARYVPGPQDGRHSDPPSGSHRGVQKTRRCIFHIFPAHQRGCQRVPSLVFADIPRVISECSGCTWPVVSDILSVRHSFRTAQGRPAGSP